MSTHTTVDIDPPLLVHPLGGIIDIEDDDEPEDNDQSLISDDDDSDDDDSTMSHHRDFSRFGSRSSGPEQERYHLIEPLGISTNCTNSFRRIQNPGGYTWKLTPPTVKDLYFEEFKKEFTWDPEDEADVKKMWLKNARKRYSDNMSEHKRQLKEKTEAGERMKTPLGMSDAFWTGLKAYWDQDEMKAISRRARENRYSEPDGVGIGISRHVGGSQSSRILQQSLISDGGVQQDAANYSTFLHLHMRRDGSFVLDRDAKLDAEIHRVAAETGRDDRLDEVYLELVHPGRSRLYGTGSAGVS
ncbi:uncharacterized protein LOC131018684 [Salvia miltiorrhiza]|uniref:uncharacterized protein LOC131018684 n=1 Tax=Salvia miltiorrhiza TaxID=226208 RepID=UPI0025AD4255|nr:uncharacterized protein LOC131018684 [Salvia miltiorrhiza]